MAAAVFSAKFSVPTPPATYQSRRRLDQRWPAWQGVRLITVTAGAGWGKTSFLATRARRLGPAALWYTLDELDRDPSVLVAHLAAAAGLASSAAPPLEQLARLVGALAERRLLVLDDVQAIAAADRAREFLGRLLRYLNPACQLVLSSREPVPLSRAHLEARGEAVRLTARDLAFDAPETEAFLRRRLGRAHAVALRERVHRLTEGWPAGLEIVSRTLAQAAADAHPQVLARLADGGGWFDRFVDESLGDLDAGTRDFLLRTSVLPHLEAALCDRLLGRDDSARVLRRLEDAGLFIVPSGDGSWRHHNLLGGCLRRRLAADLGVRTRQQAVRQAGQLLADLGEPEAALLDLARSDDPEGVRRLVRRHLEALCATRRPETLALALDLLPEDTLAQEPSLLLVRASLAQLQGRWARAEADLRRARRLPAAHAVQARVQARLVRLHLQRGRWDTCLRAGRRVLAGSPRLAPSVRGEVLAAMGVAAASLGRLATGQRYLEQALALARRRRDRELEGRCLYLLAANIHDQRGDLAAALAAATAARDRYRELDRSDLACHAEGVLGFVLVGLGREAEARQATLWAQQRADAIGYRLIAGYTRYTLGECDLLADDPTAATERFDEARAIARELGEEALLALTWLGTAEATWRLDDPAGSARAAAEALQVSERLGHRLFGARALGLRGRALAGREPRAASACLARAERILTRLGAARDLARLAVWRRPGTDVRSPVEMPSASTATAPAAAGSLTVLMLGPLEVRRGGAVLLAGAWKSRRARRLFQLLALAGGGAVARDQVLETLWPEGDPARTALNLRQTVFQLRRLVDAGRADQDSHVVTDGETVQLRLGPGGASDLESFEAALARARQARRDGRPDGELRALGEALELWRGPLLADSPYDPEVQDAAGAVRQAYLRAVDRALDLLTGRERWEEAAALARRGLTEDPTYEPFAAALLRSLLGLGHRGEAREVYARFEAVCVRELDLLPSAQLKGLAERAAGAARP
ncbi:MAG: BTAD domain-containing putative transcriptional regulator [Candidatus Krumholzibacteriia bacterium]